MALPTDAFAARPAANSWLTGPSESTITAACGRIRSRDKKGPLLPNAFVLLLGALVGSAAFALLGSPATDDLDFKAANDESSGRSPVDRGADAPTVAARRQLAEETPPTTVDWARGLVAKSRVPLLEGEGTIGGRIRSIDGKALPDIEVRLQQLSDTQNRGGSTGETDIEARVRDFARTEFWQETQRRRTRTDADGALGFESLPDARFRIALIADEWDFQADDASFGAVCPDEDLVIWADPMATCSVVVNGLEGRPADEARVGFW